MIPGGYTPITDGSGLVTPPPPPPTMPAHIAIGCFDRSSVPSDTSTDSRWSGKHIIGNYVKGYVKNLNWKAIETSQGVYDWSSMTTAKAAATSAGIQFKSRLFTNIAYNGASNDTTAVPDYVLALTDSMSLKVDASTQVVIVDFWTAPFITGYTGLIAALGANFVCDATFVEVAIAAPDTVYSEPDVRQISQSSNHAFFFNDGYTLALDQASHRACIDAHAPLTMVSSRACNPNQNGLQDLDPIAANRQPSNARTFALMDYARTTLGFYAGWGNNSIRSPIQGEMGPIYDKIQAQKLEGPVYFQTAQPNLVGNLFAACQLAVTYGATMIELPGSTADYTGANGSPTTKGMSPAQFDTINAGLATNAAALGY